MKTTMIKTSKKSESEARRLAPTTRTLRQLFALSGNLCAMPKCKTVLVTGNGTFVGRVCHIEAASSGGPRFNPNQLDKDRRDVSNLMLLCAVHHIEIDDRENVAKWTVAKLKRVKREHEAKFVCVEETLQQAYIEGYRDSTDDLDPTFPETFAALEASDPECVLDKETRKAKRKEQFRKFIRELSRVPEKHRLFMISVIQRYLKMGRNEDRPVVDFEDMKDAHQIATTALKGHIHALDKYGVGYGQADEDIEGRQTYEIRLENPSDFVTWADIDRFCSASGHTLEDFLLRLKFRLLD